MLGGGGASASAATAPLTSAPPPAVRIHATTWTCDGRLFLVSVSRVLDENDGVNHTYHSRGAARSRPRVSRMDAAMARRRDPHVQVCSASEAGAWRCDGQGFEARLKGHACDCGDFRGLGVGHSAFE